jgi:hypothetical protein
LRYVTLRYVDRDSLAVWRLVGQCQHDPDERAHVAPSLPSVVQCPVTHCDW